MPPPCFLHFGKGLSSRRRLPGLDSTLHFGAEIPAGTAVRFRQVDLGISDAVHGAPYRPTGCGASCPIQSGAWSMFCYLGSSRRRKQQLITQLVEEILRRELCLKFLNVHT